MSFFISDALAEGAAAPQGADGSFLFVLVAMGVMFYFLLIRPQSKRIKEHKKMVESLSKGDEVVTNGGMMGRITDLGENFIQLEIANGVEVKIQRQAIGSLLPKGTMKAE